MKNYLVKVCILFITFVLCLGKNIVFASLPLMGKLIVVDVGHGDKDPGTMYQDVYEKDINLAISKELENELSRLGASVILIRNDDYDLSKPNASERKRSDFDNRIKMINNSGADYYISIHLNYLEDSSYYGPQVFYNNKRKENKEIALQMQNALNKEVKTNREVKSIPKSTYMYKELEVKGVLIECGFLSNAHERSLLISPEYQKRLAKTIASALGSLKL